MRQQHRLRVLQVGAAGQHRAGVLGGLGDEGVDDVEDTGDDAAVGVAQPHPEQRGNLVVAGAPGAQLAAQLGADSVQQPAFEGGVHVFVVDHRLEGARRHVGGQHVQAREHPVQFLVGEQSGAVEHAGVGARAGDVVGRQAPVEVGRQAQRGHRLGWAGGEPAAPELGGLAALLRHDVPSGQVVVVVGSGDGVGVFHGNRPPRRRQGRWSRLAAILLGRPHSWTKPLARRWSNESPSS